MKTKNIFKTLAAALLMPAMLLTTSCSSDDDALNTPAENTIKKGYTLPVTVNVTRQGDEAATRAAYNESTKKLAFSEGDKLFVQGSYHEGDYTFAGTLDYVSDGTFSGTITTQTEWTGTIEELLSTDGGANATLLPAGYGEYGYLSIIEYDGYDAYLEENFDKAFASSKVTALEQFSCEFVYSYSSGFVLKPTNAILNFTITGLAASTEVDVEFSSPKYPDPIVTSGRVTTDASGTAIFAIGIKCYTDLNACTLTVGGNAITLVSESKMTASGKIYNINRSVPLTYPIALSEVTSAYLGSIVATDGKVYATSNDAWNAGTSVVAMIAYVGSDNHGLAIALEDYAGGFQDALPYANEYCDDWNTDILFKVTNATWSLPSQDQWKAIFKAFGGSDSSCTGLNNALVAAGDGEDWFVLQEDDYWSSKEVDDEAWYVMPSTGGVSWGTKDVYDRAVFRFCIAF